MNSQTKQPENHNQPNAMNWTETKQIPIPTWATTILIVTNAIDGAAPRLPAAMTVAQFLRRQASLVNEMGAGEWDVLIYAADAKATYGIRHPWGNTYTRLVRKAGRLKQIAGWSYMRWAKPVFSQFPPTDPNLSIVRQLATCEWQGKDSTTQNLIFRARELCGWTKKNILK